MFFLFDNWAEVYRWEGKVLKGKLLMPRFVPLALSKEETLLNINADPLLMGVQNDPPAKSLHTGDAELPFICFDF